MKRKKSPLLLRKSGGSGPGSDGSRTPKQTTPPTSSSSLLVVPNTSTTVTSSSTPVQSHVNASVPAEEYFSSEELTDWEGTGASFLSNGSTEGQHSYSHVALRETGDEVDFNVSNEAVRTKLAIDHIHDKIHRTKDLIKAEQNLRDENVNEYLKLASNADKQQVQRIKSVFEKKNQKSAQLISQLQKKLDNYHKRIRDLETHGISSSHWQPRGVLRDVGQGLKDVGTNIKEGISGLSGGVVGNLKGGLSGLSAATHTAAESVMSKPREFAHLIKNRFGSADNISSVGKDINEDGERNLHGSATFTHNLFQNTKYGSEDESSSITSGSRELPGVAGISAGCHATTSPRHQAAPATQLVTSTGTASEASIPPNCPNMWLDLEPVIQELKDECHRLSDDLDSVKSQIQQEYSYFNQALQEERYRYERLEEQMNDLIELHQNEIENLKQGISDMEEKVQYQSEERLRDVHEVLESCQTRVSRMEHQQHQHFQQLVTLDTLDNSHARALVLKLINVVLMVLQLLLLLVATLANIAMPFLQSRFRILTTTLLILVTVVIFRQCPEVFSWGNQLIERYLPKRTTS